MRTKSRCSDKARRVLPIRGAFFCLLVVSQLVAAQDSATKATADLADTTLAELGENHAEEVVDEITVIGRRSVKAIQRQIIKADATLYNLYNSLNSDSQYHIYCKNEMTTGSNIRHRACRPQFERDMRFITRDEIVGSSDTMLTAAELRRHREIMRKQMLDLAAENPALSEAILNRAALQRAYDLEKMRMHE